MLSGKQRDKVKSSRQKTGTLDYAVFSRYSREAYFTSYFSSLSWLCTCTRQMCGQRRFYLPTRGLLESRGCPPFLPRAPTGHGASLPALRCSISLWRLSASWNPREAGEVPPAQALTEVTVCLGSELKMDESTFLQRLSPGLGKTTISSLLFLFPE